MKKVVLIAAFIPPDSSRDAKAAHSSRVVEHFYRSFERPTTWISEEVSQCDLNSGPFTRGLRT